MNHYIKIFFSFVLVNYVYFYAYDNYYLIGLEEDYIEESRNQLRQYALSLRSEIGANKDMHVNIVNQWATETNIPTQMISIEEIRDNGEIYSQLRNFDYAIDIYADYGPAVIVKLDETQNVVIGPLDPLVIESTTFQPPFILFHILFNAITAYILFLFFGRKVRKIECALESIIERENVSHKSIGEQDILRKTANRVIALGSYINEIEENNFQVATDQRDLMHAVAHELRSPIARFSFALELIEDSINTNEERKMIAEMHDSIDELESLIKEILSYSRLSYGSTKLNFEQIDLVELIETSSERLKLLYPQKEFQLSSLDNAPAILADRRFLERALINLLRNAARFATKQVSVSLVVSDNNIQINIDDDAFSKPDKSQ